MGSSHNVVHGFHQSDGEKRGHLRVFSDLVSEVDGTVRGHGYSRAEGEDCRLEGWLPQGMYLRALDSSRWTSEGRKQRQQNWEERNLWSLSSLPFLVPFLLRCSRPNTVASGSNCTHFSV